MLQKHGHSISSLITMRASTVFVSLCYAATMFLSSSAEPLKARQTSVPSNEEIYNGALINYEGDGSNACGGIQPDLVEVSF